MNTNNGLPSGWTVMQQPKWKPYALQSLIDTNPYPAALAKLQKQKEDCGYHGIPRAPDAGAWHQPPRSTVS